MPDVAVGVTVFKRIDRLSKLLKSVDPEFASIVYVADDGESTEKKEEVYERSYPFDLEVFDLPFDAGLGAGRDRIVRELDEEFLLLMDSDMQMPENTTVLFDQLQADQTLGGVCGLFVEKERIFTSGCIDIYEENGVCSLELRDRKEVDLVANHPLFKFDMIANASLFRRECLEDYSWDPEYVIGREHVDFYMGHKRQTNWKFGLCPSVLFPHNPGGSNEFLKHRWNDEKYDAATEYFLQKWDLDEYKPIEYSWLATYDPVFEDYPPHDLIQRAKAKYKSDGISGVLAGGANLLKQKWFS